MPRRLQPPAPGFLQRRCAFCSPLLCRYVRLLGSPLVLSSVLSLLRSRRGRCEPAPLKVTCKTSVHWRTLAFCDLRRHRFLSGRSGRCVLCCAVALKDGEGRCQAVGSGPRGCGPCGLCGAAAGVRHRTYTHTPLRKSGPRRKCTESTSRAPKKCKCEPNAPKPTKTGNKHPRRVASKSRGDPDTDSNSASARLASASHAARGASTYATSSIRSVPSAESDADSCSPCGHRHASPAARGITDRPNAGSPGSRGRRASHGRFLPIRNHPPIHVSRAFFPPPPICSAMLPSHLSSRESCECSTRSSPDAKCGPRHASFPICRIRARSR